MKLTIALFVHQIYVSACSSLLLLFIFLFICTPSNAECKNTFGSRTGKLLAIKNDGTVLIAPEYSELVIGETLYLFDQSAMLTSVVVKEKIESAYIASLPEDFSDIDSIRQGIDVCRETPSRKETRIEELFTDDQYVQAIDECRRFFAMYERKPSVCQKKILKGSTEKQKCAAHIEYLIERNMKDEALKECEDYRYNFGIEYHKCKTQNIYKKGSKQHELSAIKMLFYEGKTEEGLKRCEQYRYAFGITPDICRNAFTQMKSNKKNYIKDDLRECIENNDYDRAMMLCEEYRYKNGYEFEDCIGIKEKRYHLQKTELKKDIHELLDNNDYSVSLIKCELYRYKYAHDLPVCLSLKNDKEGMEQEIKVLYSAGKIKASTEMCYEYYQKYGQEVYPCRRATREKLKKEELLKQETENTIESFRKNNIKNGIRLCSLYMNASDELRTICKKEIGALLEKDELEIGDKKTASLIYEPSISFTEFFDSGSIDRNHYIAVRGVVIRHINNGISIVSTEPLSYLCAMDYSGISHKRLLRTGNFIDISYNKYKKEYSFIDDDGKQIKLPLLSVIWIK